MIIIIILNCLLIPIGWVWSFKKSRAYSLPGLQKIIFTIKKAKKGASQTDGLINLFTNRLAGGGGGNREFAMILSIS